MTAAGIKADVEADPAADLEAGIGARNIVEPYSVDRADLNVLDRLRLDRKSAAWAPAIAAKPSAQPMRSALPVAMARS
jgi:hypothetical protein